jgi:hypothetical protein
MEVCCPSEKEIPECDSESIEINDMIELLPKVLKSLEDVGQKESFLKFMGLLASGTFPLQNICYLLFLDIVEWFSNRELLYTQNSFLLYILLCPKSTNVRLKKITKQYYH